MTTPVIKGGLAGRILRIDLSRGQTTVEATAPYARRWLGGRAIASWLLLQETSLDTRWSDPANPLIFSVGCLVGTLAPGACRVSVDTINAFNNGKGSANFGGHFGPELKFTGFDHLVITGRAANPVYLWIQDGDIQIRDACHLWGKTTDQTEEIIKNELGDARVRVAAIGPAGENQVRGSGIFGDCGQAAGGSGVGCVMGHKRLKAIAVRGHGSIKVADPARFMAAVDAARAKIEDSPFIQGEQGYDSFRKGLILSYRSGERPSAFPWRNGQDDFFPADRMAKLLGREAGVPRYYTRMWSCFGCPIGCQPFLQINEGKYQGTQGFTYWGNSMMYSIRLDSDDPAASVIFHLLANQLGLDADTAAVVTAWAFECYEKGLLSSQDTGGLELTWGNEDAWLELVTRLAYRQGIGDLLADGVVAAAARLGRGSEKLIAHCKGQDTVEGFRGSQTWALGVATSPVAGHHLRGAVATPAISGPKDITWTADDPDGQTQAVFWQLKMKEIEDITGTCVFMGSLSGARALEVADYAGLINAALGTALTEGQLMHLGQGAYNLEKAFNTLHANFGREDDYPPSRFIRECAKSGPLAGQRVDKDQYDRLLDRFYQLNGWDRASGWQTRHGLVALGLVDVADKLAAAGKLIK